MLHILAVELGSVWLAYVCCSLAVTALSVHLGGVPQAPWTSEDGESDWRFVHEPCRNR